MRFRRAVRLPLKPYAKGGTKEQSLVVLALAIALFGTTSTAQVREQIQTGKGAAGSGYSGAGGSNPQTSGSSPQPGARPQLIPGTKPTKSGRTPTVPDSEVKADAPKASDITPGAPTQQKDPPAQAERREPPDCSVKYRECSHTCENVSRVDHADIRFCVSKQCRDIDKNCLEQLVDKIEKKKNERAAKGNR